ncbi:MAG: site-specific integrase [Salinibacterium sp.]|nr:MAG: site-specific integrase [Salinibacterium sp.]
MPEHPLGVLDPTILLRDYAELWIERRIKADISAIRSSRTNARHVAKALGGVRVAALERRHALALLEWVRPHYAPRTVHHIIGALRSMCSHAIDDHLLAVNPVHFRRGELPPLVDRPGWDRTRAYFDHLEVEYLLGSPRVPEASRVLYAVLFLVGVRIGEAAALRWRNYEPEYPPIGRLWVLRSWSREHMREGHTKTKIERPIPVHPTMARTLDRWRNERWPAHYGREPGPDDLIFPRVRTGRRRGELDHLLTTYEWQKLQTHLAEAGLRARRLNDGRKTFLTLAVADGARKDILRAATHCREGDIVSGYIETIWEQLADEVCKLRIHGEPEQLTLPLR